MHGFMEKRGPLLLAFGRCVRRHRETLGFSQEKLAEKADLDRTYISDIERGGRNPSIRSIAAIARALGLTVAELTEGMAK